jgi:hypothetical protein
MRETRWGNEGALNRAEEPGAEARRMCSNRKVSSFV